MLTGLTVFYVVCFGVFLRVSAPNSDSLCVCATRFLPQLLAAGLSPTLIFLQVFFIQGEHTDANILLLCLCLVKAVSYFEDCSLAAFVFQVVHGNYGH